MFIKVPSGRFGVPLMLRFRHSARAILNVIPMFSTASTKGSIAAASNPMNKTTGDLRISFHRGIRPVLYLMNSTR